jgi:hypothetical protein
LAAVCTLLYSPAVFASPNAVHFALFRALCVFIVALQ